jgi:mannose-1-phosphate guanylyltransferase
MIVQPANKGTTPAIVYSLVKLRTLDKHAIVCFFPADHYYAEDELFVRAVDRAVQLASENFGSVILLGAKPRSPETAYGYIEPGAKLKWTPGSSAFWIKRFWEKPSLQDARCLVERGCLWNTFVMIGGVSAFLRILELGAPRVVSALAPLEYFHPSELETTWATDAYSLMDPSDFSEAVLSQCADELAVLELGDIEWSDLGEPHRAMAAMARMNPERNRRRDWTSARPTSSGPDAAYGDAELWANSEESVKCMAFNHKKGESND